MTATSGDDEEFVPDAAALLDKEEDAEIPGREASIVSQRYENHCLFYIESLQSWGSIL